MKTETVMTGIVIGIMLTLGSGFFWIFSDIPDCNSAKNNDGKILCEKIKHVGNYSPILMVAGIMVVAYVAIVGKPEEEIKNPNRDTTSKGPFSNKGAI